MQRQPRPLSRMHRRAALQIRKREGRLAITAIGCSQQREESGVLAYRQKLAIAECPAFGRKVERKNSDLSNKRISHDFSPSSSFAMGKFPAARYRNSAQGKAAYWYAVGSRQCS